MRNVPALLALAGVAACGNTDRSNGAGDVSAAGSTANVVGSGPAGIATALTYRGGTLEIHNVVAPAPIVAGDGAPPMAVYFFAMNSGARADTLDAVEISGGSATLHDQVVAPSGRTSMVRIDAAAIPGGEMLRFIPGGRHVMVDGLVRPITPGEVLPLTMVFRHAGRVAVAARVVAYKDLEGVIAAADDEHAGH